MTNPFKSILRLTIDLTITSIQSAEHSVEWIHTGINVSSTTQFYLPLSIIELIMTARVASCYSASQGAWKIPTATISLQTHKQQGLVIKKTSGDPCVNVCTRIYWASAMNCITISRFRIMTLKRLVFTILHKNREFSMHRSEV